MKLIWTIQYSIFISPKIIVHVIILTRFVCLTKYQSLPYEPTPSTKFTAAHGSSQIKLCFAPEQFSISCLAPSINGHVSTDVCPNNICHDSPMVQLVLIHDRVFSSIQTNCTCARPFYIHCIEEKKSHNEFNIISEEYFWQPFLYCKNHYLVKVAK